MTITSRFRHPEHIIQSICASRWTTPSAELAHAHGLVRAQVRQIWARYKNLIPPRPAGFRRHEPEPTPIRDNSHSLAAQFGITAMAWTVGPEFDTCGAVVSLAYVASLAEARP